MFENYLCKMTNTKLVSGLKYVCANTQYNNFANSFSSHIFSFQNSFVPYITNVKGTNKWKELLSHQPLCLILKLWTRQR